MRHLSKALLGAGLIALAACGGDGDDALAENVEEAAEEQADMLEMQADNATTDAAADSLEQQADMVEEAGEEKAEAIDAADPDVDQ